MTTVEPTTPGAPTGDLPVDKLTVLLAKADAIKQQNEAERQNRRAKRAEWNNTTGIPGARKMVQEFIDIELPSHLADCSSYMQYAASIYFKWGSDSKLMKGKQIIAYDIPCKGDVQSIIDQLGAIFKDNGLQINIQVSTNYEWCIMILNPRYVPIEEPEYQQKCKCTII
jgi:hypothetical protein